MPGRKGYIWIRPYTRADGIRVKGHWTPDKGKPGRGKKLFTLRKGLLTKYGYHLEDPSAKKRQAALKRAAKHEGELKVLRRVTALTIVQRPNPTYEKRAVADKKYMMRQYAKSKK